MLRALAIAAFLLAGCAQYERPPEASAAMNACLSECQQRMLSGDSLSDGPCLLDPIPENADWVCDVAHEPREGVDGNPANQCASFLEGRARHFIEVTPDCKLIREY